MKCEKSEHIEVEIRNYVFSVFFLVRDINLNITDISKGHFLR